MIAQQRRLQQLLQQRQPLLPRSLRELQRQRGGEGSEGAQRRWHLLQEVGTAALQARRVLQAALATLQRCGDVMQGRLWWRDAHLLPQPAVTVAAALRSGTASPAALLALAAVNAFLRPLWQQQLVADWR